MPLQKAIAAVIFENPFIGFLRIFESCPFGHQRLLFYRFNTGRTTVAFTLSPSPLHYFADFYIRTPAAPPRGNLQKSAFAVYRDSMTYTEKFLSDIARAAKRERAENAGRYDAKKTCEKIARSLENAIRDLGDLPRAAGDYWLTEYIDSSSDIENEPTREHAEKLAAILSFLRGEGDTSSLSPRDWKNLASLVQDEAETLPIESLSSLMASLVEQKAV